MESFSLSRRTVLRGLGTAIALPWLEAMAPLARAATGSPNQPPVRMAFLCVPNGMHMPDWTPDAEGKDFAIKSILEPVAAYRSDLLMLSGLTLNGGRALGDGPGDHARSCASFLTGAHPKKTHGADIQNGISVDQVAAEKIGSQTRFGSLELGIERGAQSGNCDSGYSCAYSSNIAWRTPTSPVAKEIDPAAVFSRLFGSGEEAEQAKVTAARNQRRASILDFALEDARRLERRLGANDRRKLDEYLFAVRDIERRLDEVDKLPGWEKGVPDYPRPAGVPSDFGEHAKLLFDLIALAFQTDSTRVVSFMFSNEGSNRTYPQVKVGEGHHTLSHHRNDPETLTKISTINHYHVTLLAHLLDKLATIKESDGSRLLDHCMIMYGSGLGDGNRHNHDDLPIAVFGRGGGALQTGQHLRFAKETPLTNLYLSMLDIAGARVASFSDSTGQLDSIRT
jgi:hypothetical protein